MEFFGLLAPIAFVFALVALIQVGSLKKEVEQLKIKSKEVPTLMEKLWAGIDKIRDMLVGDNYKVLRTSQSRTFYGFGVERFWGKIYIEYNHHSWLDHGTPYILQIRSSFIDDTFLTTDIGSSLKNIGFISDKLMEHIFPIGVRETDLAGSASEIIKEKIKQLDEMFENAKGQ